MADPLLAESPLAVRSLIGQVESADDQGVVLERIVPLAQGRAWAIRSSQICGLGGVRAR
ncbi:hypothetical protein [Nocardia amamiensis]|uniref:hypothetical protein n=1 Tax=Nocardia amamiensis TaxID=404578 RepID=UPI003400A62B